MKDTVRRHHEVAFLAAGPLLAVGNLVNGSAVTLSPLLSVMVVAMYCALSLGGVVGLAGYWLHSRIFIAAALEQGGLLIQAGGVLLWMASAIIAVGLMAWPIVAILLCWFLANLARAHDVRAIAKADRLWVERITPRE